MAKNSKTPDADRPEDQSPEQPASPESAADSTNQSDPQVQAAGAASPEHDGLEDLRGPGDGPSPRYRVTGSAAMYEPVTLRQIDWAETFGFVNLFKAFRIAMHPSKLLLALAAVLLIYAGGRVLDGLWLESSQAIHDEPQHFDNYITSGGGTAGGFARSRTAGRESDRALYNQYREALARKQNVDVSQIDRGDLKQDLLLERQNRLTELQAETETLLETAENDSARERIREDESRRRRGIYDATAREWQTLAQTRGQGLFIEFYEYEVEQFHEGLASVLRLDLVGDDGLLGRLYRFLYVGPLWGISQHPLFFTLLFIWLLVIAAIFGGAITRIAAIQVARDEKISLRSALRFSSGKFVSFLSAPLIPALIIAALALAVALAGALGNIPWLGEIVIGIGFGLALLAGLVITLVLIALIGGFSLMYPTVAAEGTDSFDAISRSFSYLYAKPWRLAFYALIAIAYAAITYLFVRFFAWLVLLCAHTTAGLLIFRDAAGRDLLSALWPAPPTFDKLSYDIDFINLSFSEDIAAVFLAIWVYLVVSLVAAFAISLYFSLSTIIYFLMRREVDATEFDDVYVDPQDESFSGYADVPDTGEPAAAGNPQ